jgi:hypothetical protein
MRGARNLPLHPVGAGVYRGWNFLARSLSMT